jgi:hypothetical protein
MRRPRGYRPTLQPLEGRLALSSFGSFLHQIFNFIPDPSSHHKAPAHPTAAQVALHNQRVAARQERLASHSHAVVAPKSVRKFGATVVGDPAPGAVPVYGPYLGRPGSYRTRPPLVAHK